MGQDGTEKKVKHPDRLAPDDHVEHPIAHNYTFIAAHLLLSSTESWLIALLEV